MNFNNTSSQVHEAETINWIFIGVHVVSILSFIFGVPVNIIIISLITKKQILRNPTNYFISSLAIADLIVLMLMSFWIIALHTSLSANETLFRYVYPSLDIFSAVSSMINVACVSVDRVIAVVYPLSHENIITKKRSLVVTGCCWLFSCIVLIMAFLRTVMKNTLYKRIIIYIGFASYFIPVLIILTSYSVILLLAVQQVKGIERFMFNVQITFNDDARAIVHRKQSQRKLLRELKITGNILLIVLPFTAGWTFFVGTHIHELVQQKIVKNVAHNFLIIIIPWLLAGLNPALYLLFTRPLRHAFIEAWQRLFKKNQSSLDETKLNRFVSLTNRASQIFRRWSASGGDVSLSIPINQRKGSTSYSCTSDKNTIFTESQEDSLLTQTTAGVA